jgi:uncharacterized membrane protein YdbT with pleckstrin-like domain
MIITPKEGEKVLFHIRKNFAKFHKEIFKFLVGFGISVFLFLSFSNQIVVTVAVGLLIVSLAYAFYNFLIWYYDVYIITNKRLIVVEQKGLFNREFAEMDLGQINDVTFSIKGIFATILQYGTVIVKGNGSTLELTDLSDPDEVQEMLKKLSEVNRKGKEPENISAKELIDILVKNNKN